MNLFSLVKAHGQLMLSGGEQLQIFIILLKYKQGKALLVF
jgi:hypothetical protein